MSKYVFSNFRDSFVDPWELETSTRLDEKQAKAAVKVVSEISLNLFLMTDDIGLQCDRDDDGVLSKTEFHSMIHRNKTKNPTLEKGDRMFEELDSNKVRNLFEFEPYTQY